MRNMKFMVLLTHLLIGAFALAQAPEKMSYQAVVRNTANNLVTSQAVGMKISILQGSTTGTAVYVETQTPTSNVNGLVSIEIGSGTVVSGTMASIDWANGPYFIKTETDPTGGTLYSITGTSQLLSTPYALYAKTSGSSIPGPQGPIGLTGATGAAGGGITYTKEHVADELHLTVGQSTTVSNVGTVNGYMLEWRMLGRPEVFQQYIYLSSYDKNAILAGMPFPTDYPRRYTIIVADGFGTMQWLGVSFLNPTTLYVSTNSSAGSQVFLERVYRIN